MFITKPACLTSNWLAWSGTALHFEAHYTTATQWTVTRMSDAVAAPLGGSQTSPSPSFPSLCGAQNVTRRISSSHTFLFSSLCPLHPNLPTASECDAVPAASTLAALRFQYFQFCVSKKVVIHNDFFFYHSEPESRSTIQFTQSGDLIAHIRPRPHYLTWPCSSRSPDPPFCDPRLFGFDNLFRFRVY